MKLKSIFFIVWIVTVCGCAPSGRLQRLLAHNPELYSTLKRDTFTVPATVYVDTTITPTQDNFITQIQVDSFYSTLFKDTCITARTSHTALKTLLQNKRCIESPILFADTVLYADKEIEFMLPLTVLLTQEGSAFHIRVQGTGGKVLSYSKAIVSTGITQTDIVRYRKQGAWYVGGSLIALLLLLGTAYGAYRIYRVRIPV